MPINRDHAFADGPAFGRPKRRLLRGSASSQEARAADAWTQFDRHAQVAQRVGVNREKLDRLDRSDGLAADGDSATDTQSVRVRQEGDQLVPLGEQVCGLAKLVHAERHDQQCDEYECSDLEVGPGDER